MSHSVCHAFHLIPVRVFVDSIQQLENHLTPTLLKVYVYVLWVVWGSPPKSSLKDAKGLNGSRTERE